MMAIRTWGICVVNFGGLKSVKDLPRFINRGGGVLYNSLIFLVLVVNAKMINFNLCSNSQNLSVA